MVPLQAAKWIHFHAERQNDRNENENDNVIPTAPTNYHFNPLLEPLPLSEIKFNNL